jgi:hypothetical protein
MMPLPTGRQHASKAQAFSFRTLPAMTAIYHGSLMNNPACLCSLVIY